VITTHGVNGDADAVGQSGADRHVAMPDAQPISPRP
jgi:hypothetical protein